ncbi:hypothetical protein IC611_08905 [Proteus mirabilis]
MAFSNIEIANIRRCMEFFMEKRRPAEHLRDELDLQYRIEDDSVIIFEIRQLIWSDGRVEEPIAKSHIIDIRIHGLCFGWIKIVTGTTTMK